ncbi:MAG: hypothetical protein M1831_005478 [Alyxoria varia]|nr:MAG: hypothetical protein M1831_005478 [Alyxoria varia]
MRRHSLEPLLSIATKTSAPSGCLGLRIKRVAYGTTPPSLPLRWRPQSRHGRKNSDARSHSVIASYRQYLEATKQPPRSSLHTITNPTTTTTTSSSSLSFSSFPCPPSSSVPLSLSSLSSTRSKDPHQRQLRNSSSGSRCENNENAAKIPNSPNNDKKTTTNTSSSSLRANTSNNKPRAFLLALFTVVITVCGTWYGATLKSEKRVHQRAQKRITATADERIAQLQGARGYLVREREALHEKISSLEKRSAGRNEDEEEEEEQQKKRKRKYGKH